MPFSDWILSGSVGMESEWISRCPKGISMDDLSPLSLEAHMYDQDGKNWGSNVFRIEDSVEIEQWLSSKLQTDVKLPTLNNSIRREGSYAPLSYEEGAKIKKMFKIETEMYGL